jgi:hypothetical protein
MRKLGTNWLPLVALAAACAVTASGAASCSPTEPTELVPGVLSQIVVPRDLGAIRVTVQVNGGSAIYDNGFDVGANGQVLLPSTLGVVNGQAPGDKVSVIIRGYNTPCEQVPECSAPGTVPDMPVGTVTGPAVLRRSVQTFVAGHTLFLPMPLSYSCWDNGGCTSDQSCKGNQCVPSTTDSASLVDFDPALLDGTDVCFDPSVCFADALPAQLVDLPSCTYAVPSLPGVTPLPGVNVRIWYQDFQWTPQNGTFTNVLQNGGELEILNLDPVEGFTLGGAPDAGTAEDGGTPQDLFQLDPGLCQLVKQATFPPPLPMLGADGGPQGDSGTGEYVTISHVEVATGCPSKPPLLPICKGEQSNLAILPGDAGTTPDGICNVSVSMTPTQSALYLAFDDSQVMNGAYGGAGSATALSVSLNDPVFKRTYAASTFFHQTTSADCTATNTSYLSPKIPFGLAAAVQSKIASQLLTWTAPDPGTMSCSTTGALDGGSTCPAGQVCAGTGTPNMFTCVTPDPLDLQAALRPTAGVYGDITNFLQGRGSVNVAAAMFFLNRAPTLQNDCNPPLNAPDGGVEPTVTQAIETEIAAAYAGTPSLKTYFVVLDDDAHDAAGALAYYKAIQSDLPQAVTVLDATNTSTMTSAQNVAANFSKIVTQLGTCLYDYGLPSNDSLDQLQVAYTIPGQPKTIIPADPNCNEANQGTVSGWNIDSGRVRICGQACSNLQSGILGAAAAALQENLPAPDIAVTATLLCAPATAQESDAGPEMADGSDCAPETCSGCCLDGVCFVTANDTQACGLNGAQCQTCTGTETCSDTGFCVGAAGTDGSSASGSSGGTGSSSGASSGGTSGAGDSGG